MEDQVEVFFILLLPILFWFYLFNLVFGNLIKELWVAIFPKIK